VKGEGAGHPGHGQNLQDLLSRRGQPEVSPEAPGAAGSARQRGHAAGVDEFEAGQIHDDCPGAFRGRRESGRNARGVRYVKFPAQGGDGQAAALADIQVYAEHRPAFPQ
jgi:hypothetical protein